MDKNSFAFEHSVDRILPLLQRSRSARDCTAKDGDQKSSGRRRFIIALGAGTMAAVTAELHAPAAEPAGNAIHRRYMIDWSKRSSLATKNRLSMELEGTISRPAVGDEGGSVEAIEIRSKSDFQFAEGSVWEQGKLVAVGRRYSLAEADTSIGRMATRSSTLRADRRRTALLFDGRQWSEFATQAPLSNEELELLHTPLFVSAVDQLLQHAPSADGSAKLSAEVLKELFLLQEIREHDVTVTPQTVKNGAAIYAVDGKLVGVTQGALTQLVLSGKLNAKTNESGGYISWIDIKLEEKRQESFVEPAFTVTARIRLLREEISEKELRRAGWSMERLAALPQAADPMRWLVEIHAPACGFKCIADRGWRMLFDNAEQAVLRWVENEEVIAQCDASRMPSLEPGMQLTLEAFQAEIERAAGDTLQQILQAEEKLTANGLRLLRCIVDGEIDGIPMQWVYCHLSDDTGRRLLLVFTVAGTHTDRFAAADEQVTTNLQLLSP
ncbi:MAG: hypothetical protein KatS3mg111_1001 [Pirellulaceae bacterium]|nr:MAG: hypothetical protein KatS3mg111_1001 [Pirellulaceae bacterium]